MAFTSKQKLKTLIKFLFEKGAAKVLDPGFHFDLQKSLNIYLQFMEICLEMLLDVCFQTQTQLECVALLDLINIVFK